VDENGRFGSNLQCTYTFSDKFRTLSAIVRQLGGMKVSLMFTQHALVGVSMRRVISALSDKFILIEMFI